jgi:hypothetical protein
MNESKSLIIPAPEEHNRIIERNQAIVALKETVFAKGVHYGEPFKGSGKPSLLKPGAELLMSRFHLWPRFVERSIVENWDPDHPVFHYRYECQLVEVGTDRIIGAGIGSCNSMEDKYRWRKNDRLCPACQEPKIIKSKYPDRQTGEIGWYCLACKTTFSSTDSRITEQETGKVPNNEIFTLVNTLDKMAQKRAFVAAVLVATGASAYFTQDVEDFPNYTGEIIEGELIPPEIETPAAPAHKTEPRIPIGRDPQPTPRADPPVEQAPATSKGPNTWATPSQVDGLIKWAQTTVWKAIDWTDEMPHLYNRIAKALGFTGDGTREGLHHIVMELFTGSRPDARYMIQTYEPEKNPDLTPTPETENLPF